MMVGVESIYNFNIFTKIIIMRYLYSFLFILVLILFNACEEDEDPTTVSLNYIEKCNEVQFYIQFYNTNFWDNDGFWWNLNNNGNQLINPLTGTTKFCRKELDESTVDPNAPIGDIDFEQTNDSYLHITHNSDGKQDIEFVFLDKGVAVAPYGYGEADIWIQISLDDIDSYNQNQTYSGGGGPPHRPAFIGNDSWTFNWDLTFTNIDVSNHIYEGNISLSFSPWSSIEYEDGTSLNFTAEITNFRFDAP
jgi:hypothetical protein